MVFQGFSRRETHTQREEREREREREREMTMRERERERDCNNIFRNPLTATCDDGTCRPASEFEKREKETKIEVPVVKLFNFRSKVVLQHA